MAEAAVQPAETRPASQAVAQGSVAIGRELGFWTVFVFAFSSIGLTYGGLRSFSTFYGLWPGANFAAVLAVSVVISLVYAYTFAAVGALAQRYGADYVLASRVVSPPLAFASSWTLVLFLAIWGGGLVARIARDVIPLFINIFSRVMFDKSLAGISTWAASPSGMITLGTVGVVLIFLVLFLPSRFTRWALLVGILLTVAALGLSVFVLASTPADAFQGAWDYFMGEGSFIDHLVKARQIGLVVNFSPSAMILAGFMLSLLLFWGCNTPTYIAGEVKDPRRNLLMGGWMALAASLVLLGTVIVLLQRLVPLEWLSAESFLSHNAAFDGQAMPWLPFYIAIMRPNAILIYLLAFAWIFTLLALAHTLFYAASRVILAWAEDHLITPAVLFVHPELRSPLISVLLVCLLAEVGVVAFALVPGVVNALNPVFFVAILHLLPVLALVLLPFTRRDWFARAKGAFAARIGPVPVLPVVAAVSLLYLVGTLVALIVWPVYNPLNSTTILFFAFALISGLAWFFIRRAMLKKQGQDLDALYKALPEE